MESAQTKLKMSRQLLFIGQEYDSPDDLIREAGKRAIALGFAEEGYVEDVIEREREYPTGLNAVMPIAIPHVGTHCAESFMSIATLRTPLSFAPMDGRGGMLPVRVVFLFGLVDHRDQVKVLQRLAQMFKDKEALTQLTDAKDDEEACRVVVSYLGDLVEIV